MKPKNQFGLSQSLTLLFQSRLDCFAEGKVWHKRLIKPVNKANLALADCNYFHHWFMEEINQISFCDNCRYKRQSSGLRRWIIIG